MGLRLSLPLISLVLFAAPFQPHTIAHSTNETCSREASRKVASIIKRELSDRLGLKVLEKVSISCPWHPARNLYGEQEKSKNRINYDEIQCLFCRKRFVSEFYLDRHMETHHNDKLNMQSDNAVCLADYCDLFQCNQVFKSRNYEIDEDETAAAEQYNRMPGTEKFISLQRCSEKKVVQLQQQCRQLAEDCFSTTQNSAITAYASNAFERDVCSHIRCEGGVLRAGFRPASETVGLMSFGIFRIVTLVIVAIVAFILIVMLESSMLAPFIARVMSGSSSSSVKKDYLGGLQRSRQQVHSNYKGWMESLLLRPIRKWMTGKQT